MIKIIALLMSFIALSSCATKQRMKLYGDERYAMGASQAIAASQGKIRELEFDNESLHNEIVSYREAIRSDKFRKRIEKYLSVKCLCKHKGVLQ